ncbi:MAG: hypothetical protein M3Q32_04115 [Pseudomonadota bacterium]|nr:hypothetical protein [Pseudomonadota bacterium]
MRAKPAPKHLSEEARAQWKRLLSEYNIEDEAGLLLLQTGMEAFDRMRIAQELIRKHGAVTMDRFAQLRPNRPRRLSATAALRCYPR